MMEASEEEEEYNFDYTPIYHEMEAPDEHGGEVLVTEQASNVVLTETPGADLAIATQPQFKTWSEYCSSEAKIDYEHLVNRWMHIDTFEWTKDQATNTQIRAYNLPLAYLKNADAVKPCNVPNSVPFNIYRYWRGDIEVKFYINSNKFQTGSLQCAWLYQPILDKNITIREHIYCLSQTNHIIINASTSNEATILIPFKYYVPLLHTKNRVDMNHALVLGKLYVNVLNQLVTSESSDGRCNITVYMRCVNSEFTGMLSGDIDSITGEMYSIGRALGETALNSLFPDNNRDNPPCVSAPKFLVPTASHSWSVGTGLHEPLHPLRLDPKGQTPHPPGIEINDEMIISKVARTFGLLVQIPWRKEAPGGFMLYSCPVSPLMDQKYYMKLEGNNAQKILPCFYIPPVGVVSSMFMAWRGTLEFRFDVVASQYHTGRLMVGFIPGIVDTSKITMSKLKCSTYSVFSIVDTTSFTYQVPFISNKPVWPRRYGGDHEAQDVVAPATLFIYVVNSLIPMQSVSNNVYINVYMRAGEDFEVVVPVQPSLGLGWNRKYITSDSYPEYIQAVEGFSPYYSGNFEDLDYSQVFRWGQYSHQIAHFDNENFFNKNSREISYCRYEVKNNEGNSPPTYWNGKEMRNVEWCVFVYVNALGYNIGLPCYMEEDAKKLATNLFSRLLSVNDSQNAGLSIRNTLSTVSNTFCKNNIKWTVIVSTIVNIETEIGEQNKCLNLTGIGTTNTLMSGYLIYGEKFFSFKDLCRRYQYYTTLRLSFLNQKMNEMVVCRFPVVPIGLALKLGSISNINQLQNRLREGHIPLISSGYRYYRGGIRFRLVANTEIGKGYTIIIQHRPDRALTSYEVTYQDTIIDGDSVMNHTYGSYLQFSAINNIIEFEVPFYLMGMYGLLQQFNFKEGSREAIDYVSLGDINVSLIKEGDIGKIVRFDVFYAIADDMSFSTFQGFPPMIICNNIPPDNPPKLTLEETFEKIEFEMDEINHEGLWDYLPDFQRGASNILATGIHSAVVDTKKEVTDSCKSLIDSAVETITQKFSNYDFNNTENLVLMGIELLHLINHRDISTLSLVTIKILIHFKMIVVNNLMALVQSLASMLKMWVSRLSSDQPHVEEVVITHEMEVSTILLEEWKGVIGMLYAGVGAALSISVLPRFNFENLTNFFTKTVPNITRGTTFLIGFFTVIGALVSRIGRWLINKIYPVEGWYHRMSEEMPTIKKWMDEVLYLDGIDLETRITDLSRFQDRIFAAYVFGQRILAHFGEGKEAHIILKIFDLIKKKYLIMLELGKHPFIRKEPFVLWMYGDTRIGKSYLTEHISARLLAAVNYPLRGGSRVFTIMPTNEFWSGCKHQPVLCMDDAFSVEMGQTVERTLNYIYMIKSSCTLNPPQAELEHKHHRYNPEIFYINSNKKFINIANVDATAVHSRRDVLIEACVIDPTKPKASDYTMEQLETFSHLQFRTALDVCDTNTGWTEWMTFEEMMICLKQKYKKFVIQEARNFQRRMDTYDGVCVDTREDLLHCMTLQDELNVLNARMAEEYELAKRECLWMKCTGGMNEMFQLTKEYLATLFNKFTSFDIKPEMDDKPSCSYTTPATFTADIGVDEKNFAVNMCDDDEDDDWLERIPAVQQFKDTYRLEAYNLQYIDSAYDKVINIVNCNVFVEETVPNRFGEFFNGRWNLMADANLAVEDKERTKTEILVAASVVQDALNKEGKNVGCNEYDFMFPPEIVESDTDSETSYASVSSNVSTLGAIYQGFVEEKKEIIIPQLDHIEKKVKFKHGLNLVAGQYTQEEFLLCGTRVVEFLKKKHYIVAPAIPDDEFAQICFENQNLCLLFEKISILHYDILIAPFKKNYFPACDNISFIQLCVYYALIDPVFKFNISRYTVNTFWNKIKEGLRMLYPECKHLRAKMRWDFDSRKYLSKLKNEFIEDDGCDGVACIYNNFFGGRLLALRCISQSTTMFWQFARSVSREDMPFVLQLGNEGKKIGKDIEKWSESFSSRAYRFITQKMPGVLYKGFIVMSIIGAIVATFMGTFAIFKGFKNCMENGYSFDNFTQIFRGSSLVANSGVACVAATNALGGNREMLVPSAEAAGSYASTQSHSVNPKVCVVPQGSQANMFNILRVIEKNYFLIRCEYVNERNVVCHLVARGLKISGYNALMIKHYFEEFDTIVAKHPIHSFYYVTNNQLGSRLSFNYKALEFKYFSHADKRYGSNLVLVKLPPQIPMGRDIRSMIKTSSEHQLVGSTGSLFEFGKGHHLDLMIGWAGPFQIAEKGPQSSVHMANAYTYGIHQKGMCGSVLLTSANTSSPIIGFHVAGGGSTGYAEPLFREMFEILIDDVKGLPIEEEVVHAPDIQHEVEPSVELRTTVIADGCIVGDEVHIETGKTSYVQSLVHGVYPHDTEPNPLSHKDPRLPEGVNPMQVGCELMGFPVKSFDVETLDRSFHDYRNLVLNVVHPLVREVRVLTREQAIVGIPELEHYESLNWNSSPGFNFKDKKIRNYQEGGKKWLFNLEETSSGYICKGINSKLELIMDEKEMLRKRNIVPETVFVDCLKDTCIDITKIGIPGKTRIFSISPVDFTIQFRQYCGDFMAAFTKARFKVESGIGMSTNGPEWGELANLLQGNGTKFITGDYSNFGPGLSLEVAAKAFDVIIDWYKFHKASEEHIKILNIMKYEIIGAKHLCFNLIYTVCCGIPSGSPITSILNSMVNCLYVRYAYFSIMRPYIFCKKNITWDHFWADPANLQQDYLHFNKFVVLVTYGDDLIMSVKDEIINMFNFNSIAKIFGLHNIKFTPASKQMIDIPDYYTKLQDLTFLSCGFALHPHRTMQWLAPLKEISIHSCANWVKKKGDIRDNTSVNVRQALLLSYGHGKAFYEKQVALFRRRCIASKIAFRDIRWEDYDRMFFEDGDTDFQITNLYLEEIE